MIIDPNSPVGIVRLRVADYSDFPILSDEIIQATLTQNDNNIVKASKVCAQYILGLLSSKVRRKMSNLEVYGKDYFDSYKEFIMLTISNPSFIDVYPIPYMAQGDGFNPIVDFVDDWKRNYYNGTESQQLAIDAERSPNDGSRFGFGGLV